MKLDKIKFAKLIAYIATEFERPVMGYQIEAIDEMVDVDVPQPDVAYLSISDINTLIALMAGENPTRSNSPKIEAIKLHRKLTGWGLKESKEEVEKYWPKPINPPISGPAFPAPPMPPKPAPIASVATLRELGGKPEPFGNFSDMV